MPQRQQYRQGQNFRSDYETRQGGRGGEREYEEPGRQPWGSPDDDEFARNRRFDGRGERDFEGGYRQEEGSRFHDPSGGFERSGNERGEYGRGEYGNGGGREDGRSQFAGRGESQGFGYESGRMNRSGSRGGSFSDGRSSPGGYGSPYGEHDDDFGGRGQRGGSWSQGQRGYSSGSQGSGRGYSGSSYSQGGYGGGYSAEGSWERQGNGERESNRGWGQRSGQGSQSFGNYGRESSGRGFGGNQDASFGGDSFAAGNQQGFRGGSNSSMGTLGTSRRRRADGRGPKGYQRSDERLKEDISERLMQNDDVDASEVTVEVKNGNVILEGTVCERWMKHEIEDLADDCMGVKDVDNKIRVSRESKDSSSDDSTSDGKSQSKGNSSTKGANSGSSSIGTGSSGSFSSSSSHKKE